MHLTLSRNTSCLTFIFEQFQMILMFLNLDISSSFKTAVHFLYPCSFLVFSIVLDEHSKILHFNPYNTNSNHLGGLLLKHASWHLTEVYPRNCYQSLCSTATSPHDKSVDLPYYHAFQVSKGLAKTMYKHKHSKTVPQVQRHAKSLFCSDKDKCQFQQSRYKHLHEYWIHTQAHSELSLTQAFTDISYLILL